MQEIGGGLPLGISDFELSHSLGQKWAFVSRLLCIGTSRIMGRAQADHEYPECKLDQEHF